MTRYDAALFQAAHKRLMVDAKTLTDDDLAQFAAVDPTLADRARAKRNGFVEAYTPAERKAAERPATLGQMLDYVNDTIAPVLATYRYRLEESRALIVALEQRLAAVERKPHVKFTGVWKAGTSYTPGDAATYQGALWICKAPTPGEPSKDFHGWQLAVKSGGAR
jgi:hypothetical protein